MPQKAEGTGRCGVLPRGRFCSLRDLSGPPPRRESVRKPSGPAARGSGLASRQARGLLSRTWQATETGRWGVRPEPRGQGQGTLARSPSARLVLPAPTGKASQTRARSVPQSTGPPSLIAAALHTDALSGILTRCLSDTSQSDVQMGEPRGPLKCQQAGDRAGEGHTAASGTHVDWQGSAALLLPVNLLEPSLLCWRVQGQRRHPSPSPAPGPRALTDTAGVDQVAGRAPCFCGSCQV